ncbi:MAG: hypothetical protein ACU0DT_12560 [Albimonas sp.]|uniref:hypothetical protein n=1 Tax=Albimonas sp. TaxID=1872425 RepID=UPI00405607D8
MSPRRALRPPARPEGPDPEEKRGLMVSAGAHVAVVLVAIFGGPLFKGDEAQAVRIADVDLITSSEFDAMVSQAPQGPRGDVASLVPPRPGEDRPAPEAPAADTPPQRAEAQRSETAPAPTRPPEPQETAPAQTAAPASRPEAPRANDAPVAPPKGVTASSPPLPAGPERLDAPQRDAPATPDAAPPRDLDRVAPTPAPPKQTIAEADTPTPATRPAEQQAQTPPPPQQPAAAPQEATTQIVTEADETSEQDTLAPVASAPPRGRPEAPDRSRAPEPETQTAAADPQPAPAAKPDPKPAAKPDPAPASAAKPDPKPAQQTAAAPSGSTGATTNAPEGPRLTSGQVNGVRLGVQKYWRMDRVTNLPNYEELVVVIQVTLDQSGKMVGKPKVVQPSGVPDARWRVAIQVAEIAAARAATEGFQLPRESYGRWKTIEFKFNPGQGVQM